MMGYVFDWLAKMYAALSAASNPLETGKLVLLGQPLTYTGNEAAGDITKPNFTGYADYTISAFVAAIDSNGVPYLSVAPHVFSPTNGTNLPQYIYGAAILDTDGDLVLLNNWATPLQLSRAGQQLHVSPKVKLAPTIQVEIEAYVE